MTRTRYLSDLLNTTHHHVEEYEAELREAERKGTPRRRAMPFPFGRCDTLLRNSDFAAELRELFGPASG